MEQTASCRISEHFSIVDDPRIDRSKRHQLLDIITIALCGVICGADSWVEIEAFGQAKLEWLRSFLELPNGIPSHDTFGRVFAALDPQQFEEGFASWVETIAQDTSLGVIALDGKTLRRSHNRSEGQKALHLVSAWASANRLVLGQIAVDAKSNEITALPRVLDALKLGGSTVTIDAMGCQREIAQGIVSRGAEYVLALKGNHKTLYEEVQQSFIQAGASKFAGIAHEEYQTVEKGHGRVEVRHYTTISEPSWIAYLQQNGSWAGLRSIGQVHTRRDHQGNISEETRYYLSSLPGTARVFAEAVRDHWSIENGEHWILDIAFREDESRVRQGHAAQNLAVLRRLALNLLRQESTSKVGVKAKRLKAAWDENYLLSVLFH
jgi:predicted transposase YbfD/YdcC